MLVSSTWNFSFLWSRLTIHFMFTSFFLEAYVVSQVSTYWVMITFSWWQLSQFKIRYSITLSHTWLLFIIYFIVLDVNIDNQVFLLKSRDGRKGGRDYACSYILPRKLAKWRVYVGEQWKEKSGKAEWGHVLRTFECQDKLGKFFLLN